jgi:ABC-type branched-subunit amino acid transport system permease subunit
MGILIAVFVFMTKRMTFGRRIYAMGGNEKAAKLSGIHTERLTFYIFVIMGALAALAGLIYSARLNMATPGPPDLNWTSLRPSSSVASASAASARSPARSSAPSSWAS